MRKKGGQETGQVRQLEEEGIREDAEPAGRLGT